MEKRGRLGGVAREGERMGQALRHSLVSTRGQAEPFLCPASAGSAGSGGGQRSRSRESGPKIVILGQAPRVPHPQRPP